jgi:hypothetical protein
MQTKTYNRYLTKGVIDETIETRIDDGVNVYLVRKPKEGEEVIGYVNLSDFLVPLTPTEVAEITNK